MNKFSGIPHCVCWPFDNLFKARKSELRLIIHHQRVLSELMLCVLKRTTGMKRVHDGILTYTRGVEGIIHDIRVLQGEHHKCVKFSVVCD